MESQDKRGLKRVGCGNEGFLKEQSLSSYNLHTETFLEGYLFTKLYHNKVVLRGLSIYLLSLVNKVTFTEVS
jgi:hypothetical protein